MRPPFDPVLDMYHSGLWGVVMAYVERRSVMGAARSMRLPEEVMRWRRVGGVWVGEPGFCSTPSTKPPEPGRLEELGVAWNQLGMDQRMMILDCVVMQDQPWLRGKQWRARLRQWRMSPKKYERLLALAWRSLKARYYRRQEAEEA